MKVQVDKCHYDSDQYVTKERWMSYYYQINLIRATNPENILEIGPGNNFLKNMFQHSTDYRTYDIAHDLNPDIVGSIENISFRDNSFDLVCAFQVLEHLPFTIFETCLNEMARVSKSDILISLPYQRRKVFIMELKVPFIPTLRISINMPKFYRDYYFDGEHYWEVGARGYSLKKIKRILSKYFTLTKVIHPYENKYHIFFVLKNR